MSVLRKHPVASFLCLTYVITWAIAFPMIATRQGWFGFAVSYRWHYATAYAPLIAAIVVTGLTGSGKNLLSRLTRWRVGWKWFSVAALSPLVVFFIAVLSVKITSKTWPEWHKLGLVNYLPYIGLGTLPFWILNSGLGEEAGWRGFLLPEIQKAHRPITAGLIVGIFWIVWHVPFFFYLDTYMAISPYVIPGFALGVVSGSIILTWLYNGSGGSALMAVLWHGVWNFVSATKIASGSIAAVSSMLVLVWSIILVFVLIRQKNPTTMRP